MCSHPSGPVCLRTPTIAQARLKPDERGLLFEVVCSGDLPCTGSFIVGVAIADDIGSEVRHCCLEYTDGRPVAAFTFDMRENWQVCHGTPSARGPLLRGSFPGWSLPADSSEARLSAFCIQNGALTARDLPLDLRA